MSYQDTNRETIRTSFKRLRMDADMVARNGMIALAQEALAYVANAHEILDEADPGTGGHGGERLEVHIQGSNVLAVAVGHNGDLVFSQAYEGGFSDEGHAEEVASDMARSSSAGCWVAVVLSDMEGSGIVPYKESKEEEYLAYSLKMTSYYAIHNFKPIRR